MNADTETTARAMYDAYCAAVGGKAWNGQPLPGSGEFFADPAKKVQADGWRAAAATATDHINRKEHTMTEEQKNEVKFIVGSVADELSDKALAAAREKTNKLWKIMLYAVGIMLAGIAALAGFTGCQNVPHVTFTAEQVQQAHEAYHVLTGKDCILVLPVEDYKK